MNLQKSILHPGLSLTEILKCSFNLTNPKENWTVFIGFLLQEDNLIQVLLHMHPASLISSKYVITQLNYVSPH